jgi:hypothetical protein
MKGKAFVFESTSNSQYDVSVIHYNDDLCFKYDPDDYNEFPKYCEQNSS